MECPDYYISIQSYFPFKVHHFSFNIIINNIVVSGLRWWRVREMTVEELTESTIVLSGLSIPFFDSEITYYVGPKLVSDRSKVSDT